MWRRGYTKSDPPRVFAVACDIEDYIAAVGYSLEILLDNTVVWDVEWEPRPPQAEIYLYYTSRAPVGRPAPDLWIVADQKLWQGYGQQQSLPSHSCNKIEEAPLLYGSATIERSGSTLRISADIVASAYFMLTRYEEIVRPSTRDRYGRFPGKECLQYRAGFLDRPVVEEYAALLRKWLREIGFPIPRPERRFSVLVTHDVDNVRRYQRGVTGVKKVGIDAVRGRLRWSNFGASLVSALGLVKDPWDNFDLMIQTDAGLKSTADCIFGKPVYFFMARRRGPQEGYNFDEDGVQEAIAKVRRSPACVGLHTSYAASMNPAWIAEEKKSLEAFCGVPIRRNRFHALAWTEVAHGWHLANAGVDWDSTLGFADVAGFRLGACHPIPLFDPVKLRLFGIEEHPLIVMDCSLDSPHYMALGEEQAFQYCKGLLDQTKKHQGEFVLLWHNNAFSLRSGTYYLTLYLRLLAEAAAGSLAVPERRRGAAEAATTP